MPQVVATVVTILAVAAQHWLEDVRRGRALVAAAAAPPSVERVAGAVADALCRSGLTEVGSEGPRISTDDSGDYSCGLGGVGEAQSQVFATALDEVVSPIATPPRYVLPRWGDLACGADGPRRPGRHRPVRREHHDAPHLELTPDSP